MFALVSSLSVDKDLRSAGLPHSPSVDMWTCLVNATCDGKLRRFSFILTFLGRFWMVSCSEPKCGLKY